MPLQDLSLLQAAIPRRGLGNLNCIVLDMVGNLNLSSSHGLKLVLRGVLGEVGDEATDTLDVANKARSAVQLAIWEGSGFI